MAVRSGYRRWLTVALLTVSLPATTAAGAAVTTAPGAAVTPPPGAAVTPPPGAAVTMAAGAAVTAATGTDVSLTVGGRAVLLDVSGSEGRPRASARFSATAGQRLSVLARRKTLTAVDNTDLVVRRDGTTVAEGTLPITWSEVTVDFTAPAAGTYTVEVRPRAKDHGTLLVSLAGATAGALTVGGEPQRVAVTKPGERVFLTFDAPADEDLTLVARRGSMPRDEYTHLEVRGPGGEPEAIGAVGYGAEYRTLDFTTTVGGSHTVEVNPDTVRTGTLMVHLAGTVTAALTPGRPARITLARPGDRGRVTFRAAEDEQFRLTARRDTLTGSEQTRLRLTTPAGLDVADGTLTTGKAVVTLSFSSSAGVYTLDVDPDGLDAGSLILELTRLTEAGLT